MKNNKFLLALVLIIVTLSQFGCGGGSGDSGGSSPTSIAAPTPAAAVSITALSASSASPGATLTVSGAGFRKVNAVTIGSVSVTFTIINDTQIAITVPTAAVSGVVTLSGPGFSVQSSTTFISNSSSPLVTSVSAANVVAGGNFTIAGKNLDLVTSYQIAGLNLAVVNSSSTSATLMMPTQAISGFLALKVGNTVVNSTYQINGYLPASIVAVLPQIGIVGSSVTVNGSGLIAVTKVRFANGAIASVSNPSNTAVSFTVPPDAASGQLTVVDPYQEVQTTSSFTVAPTVTATGLQSAKNGSTVILTITGTNLDTVTAAKVGNSNAAIVSRSNAQLVLTVSIGTSGTVILTMPAQAAVNAGTIDSAGNVGLLISSVDFVHVFAKSATDPTLRLTPSRPALVRATVLAPSTGIKSPVVNLSASTKTGASLGALVMSGPATLPTAKDDYNLSNSFNVMLPAAWVQPGVKVSINVLAGVGNSPANLDVSPTVGAPTRIRVVLVPLTVGAATGVLPPNLFEVQKALARVFPYAYGNIVVQRRQPLTINGATSTNTMSWSAVLKQLDATRVIEDQNAFYYGFVPMYNPIPPSYTAGIGYVGDRSDNNTSNVTAIGLDQASTAAQGDPFDNRWQEWLTTMVHEMGHNHSLQHAPCGGASDPDPAYPNSNADLSSLAVYNSLYDSDTQIGVLSAPHTPNNMQMKDVMGYCDGTWFSDFSYVRAQQFAESRTSAIPQPMVRTSAASVGTQNGYLTISGELTSKGVFLYPASATATKLQADTVTAKSTYELRVRTVTGQNYRLPFKPTRVADAIDQTSHFSVSMPNPGEVAAIEVMYNGRLQVMRQPDQVRRLKASPQTATGNSQEMASSVGWNIQNGHLTVTWNAVVEPFLSLVYVEPSGAKIMIGNGLEKGSASFDISGLPRGGRFDLSLSSPMQARLVSFPH